MKKNEIGGIKIESVKLEKSLDKLRKQSPKMFNLAQRAGALQFLTWSNTGTGRVSAKPPIKWGVLRGSSSAFVGSFLVKINAQAILSGATERPTPAREYSQSNPNVMTWVWNTAYAAKLHEHAGGWGERTTRDGDAGAGWVTKNLRGNKDDLMKFIAKNFENRMDKLDG